MEQSEMLTQIGGSVYLWRVSDGQELVKHDVKLPEYSMKLEEYWRAKANDSSLGEEGKNVQSVYEKAVRKRIPRSLSFDSDSSRLTAISELGARFTLDARTGRKLDLPQSPKE